MGALLLLDAFQATGVVPVEVEKWGVDACVGGCLKWLCGGPGNVYLYVDPELAARLKPRLTGWMAHPAPFAFDPPPMRQRAGAWRFLNGTPQIACLYAAEPGLRIHNEIGVPAIREKSKRMTHLLFECARERGWRVHAPTDPRPSFPQRPRAHPVQQEDRQARECAKAPLRSQSRCPECQPLQSRKPRRSS